MKTTLLTLFMALTLTVLGQNSPNGPIAVYVDFENPIDSYLLSLNVDTADANNIWQIGVPQKSTFTEAISQPNAIVTDRFNTYPINSNSTFYVNYKNYNCPHIGGHYNCDTDSLNDYGTIEISLDSGQTWVDLLATNTNQTNNPILTGNSNGWQYFDLTFSNLIQQGQTDSIILKFSFISDSIDTQHDGLMFDDLFFCIEANTQSFYKLNDLKVFPNPTSDLLNFQFEEPIDDAEIRIYSPVGQLMGNQNIINTAIQFDVSNWNKGVYFYGIYVEGKLVKQGQVLVRD